MKKSIENIVFMEICKNDHDEPIFCRYCVQNIDADTDATEILHTAILDQRIPSCVPHVPTEYERSLSFSLLGGYNIYVIKFSAASSDRTGAARFGPGMAPITLIGADQALGPDFFKNVRLLTVIGHQQSRQIQVIQISDDYECMPADSWAVFECDLSEFDNIMKQRKEVENSENTHEHLIQIPFYLNIYDEESNLPIWYEFANAYHDGYHPPSRASYAVFGMTHAH